MKLVFLNPIIEKRRTIMSLNVDPRITVEQIKKGGISGARVITEINNLIAEVTSGIYTLKQMGLRNRKELEGLKKLSTH